jgi:CheY-like chemotaxis protein
MNRAERHGWATGLLGAWAVGAVDPEEEADMRRHLAECPTCRQEATQLRDAVEQLVDAGELASPSVWEEVLSTIHSRVGPEAEDWLAKGAPVEPPRIRVGLVDDEADMRNLWRTWLSQAGGFEVVGEAHDGDGAVALAVREHPDVLVLDLAMPGRSGLDALGRLEACAPATKVLACSAHEDLLSEAVVRGADGSWLKNRSQASLPESLRRLIARED